MKLSTIWRSAVFMLKMLWPYEYVKSVFTIDYEQLYKKGYKGIIFDIDNTLVHHGDNSTPEIDSLIKDIQKMGFKTLLLSNNNKERIERFIENIDSLYIDEAEKPNIEGFEKALEMLSLNRSEVVIVGDQIFTDILGANRCGIKNILVEFIRLEGVKKIGKKRQLERLILKLYSLNKTYQNRIGNIERRYR